MPRQQKAHARRPRLNKTRALLSSLSDSLTLREVCESAQGRRLRRLFPWQEEERGTWEKSLTDSCTVTACCGALSAWCTDFPVSAQRAAADAKGVCWLIPVVEALLGFWSPPCALCWRLLTGVTERKLSTCLGVASSCRPPQPRGFDLTTRLLRGGQTSMSASNQLTPAALRSLLQRTDPQQAARARSCSHGSSGRACACRDRLPLHQRVCLERRHREREQRLCGGSRRAAGADARWRQ